MARKKYIPVEPHIVERVYDENGNEIGWIADNFVTHDEKEIQRILDEIGRIWGEACERQAREVATNTAINRAEAERLKQKEGK